ncbi:hypothetical protein [Arthrobacter sp. NEB 688]|uniref:hypothetical protein n=1 Tax=Arthrobacter sp. NEB 688 TaxID=904039 RepID=UPI001564A422|nr:hypothetical protein [Arthrobacter sp. NEB 688]QKE83674.1 hypothetical protein HL663_06795 [Arthrobacter sp. NEB 688]
MALAAGLLVAPAAPSGAATASSVAAFPVQATTLSVTKGASTYVYGASAKLAVHLSVPDATVSVYATPYHGTKKLLTTTVVDANGDLTVTTPVTVRTAFTVEYAGDVEHEPAIAGTHVDVRAKVTTRTTRVIGHSGSYQLVRTGSKPYVVGTVAPSHAGQCVKFQGQEPKGSGWGYTQTTDCFRLNSKSATSVYFGSSWPAGAKVRMRVLWGGDTKNAAANSAWTYLKFVR